MKIIIFENVLTHYRLKFYNYLIENYNIDIVFMTPSIENSDGFHTNYNNAKFIEECIYSLRNQTYKNMEIIFFDDLFP